MGSRHNMSLIEPAYINETITEVHRLTRTPLCIHQDDAKEYYDRIIRNHATLNNKKILIPDNVGKNIMRPTKRWNSKPNSTTQYPKRPTSAQKHFPSVEWDKDLVMREQNRYL